MMRPILIFLLLALVGALVILSFYGHNGYVLLSFAGYVVETSLAFFAFVVVALTWAGWTLLRLLQFGWLLPGSIRDALRNRRNRRARESLARGLLKLAEGRWSAAETEITRQAPQHDASVVNYLYAARVAQQRGDIERRDQYLRQAYGAKPHAEVAVLLTQAELQTEHGQLTQALASLLRVQELEPGQPHGQAQLAELYARMEDWAALYALLERIEKDELLDEARWLELAVRAQGALLATAAKQGRDTLRASWSALPRRLRRQPSLIAAQARLLVQAGAQDEAATLLRAALDRGWDAGLALLFSRLQVEDPLSQLAAVEAWLKRYGDEPMLQFVAGRLCRQNKLWGRARSYLEASFKALPQPGTLLELGRVHEATNNPAAAQAAYREGLELAAQEVTAPAIVEQLQRKTG